MGVDAEKIPRDSAHWMIAGSSWSGVHYISSKSKKFRAVNLLFHAFQIICRIHEIARIQFATLTTTSKFQSAIRNRSQSAEWVINKFLVAVTGNLSFHDVQLQRVHMLFNGAWTDRCSRSTSGSRHARHRMMRAWSKGRKRDGKGSMKFQILA